MVPVTFKEYFLGSAGASAALIGLLFVAVSVAPERVFGRQASAEQRALAGSAFMALVDAFFISLVAPIPKTNLGYCTLVVGSVAVINTFSLGRHVWEERRAGRGVQRFTLLLWSVVVYGWELWYAVQLIRQPQDADGVYGLAYLLVGAYTIGIVRAWELMGAPGEGLFTLLGHPRDRRDAPQAAEPEPRSENDPHRTVDE